MTDRRQHGRRQAKAGHRVGRHRLQPTRHHRITRPDESGAKRRGEARKILRRDMAQSRTAAADHQQRHAHQPKQRANNVVRLERLARQECREHHDQQRPQIIQQSRFGWRREPQRQKIQRVIAEQPADTDKPHHQRLAQRPGGAGTPQPCQRSGAGADCKRHGGELEGRDAPGRDRQRGQQRPHHDGEKADKGSSVQRHAGVMTERADSRSVF